jgi:chain length determinant protein EpsF
MTLSQFLCILRARWNVGLLILVATVGLAMGASLLLPKHYTATAMLVVDQTRPDPVTGTSYTGNPSPAFMATQVDVLKSDRVAINVVRQLGLANNASLRDLWMQQTRGEGGLENWLVERVRTALEVKPSRESNVISVSFKDADPSQAASTANLFVQSYLDVNLALRVEPAKQYSTFFESRAKELRANLEGAQAKLSAYQREKGVVVASEGQLDVETARLNELSSQLVALQAVTADSGSRQAQAQSGADGLHEVVNNPILAGLNSDITRAEAKLQEMAARLGENHPQLIEAKANVSTLRIRLSAETRRVTGTVGVSNSINRQREAEIRSTLEAQRSRVMRLRTAREEGSVLMRDVDAAHRAYEAMLTRLTQTHLESQATQSNAYVLSSAVPPLSSSSPKLLRNLMLSLLVGAILAITAAIVLEYVDRRVRTDDQISEALGMPLLGTLPKPGGKGRFVGRRTPLVTSGGFLRRLPAPGKRAGRKRLPSVKRRAQR